MNKPEVVSIDPKIHKLLLEQQSALEACQHMMVNFQKNYEQRMVAIQQATKQIWLDLKEKHGLDLENINYDVHPTESKVVPIQMRLRP